MRTIVVLLSGGLDSAALCALAGPNAAAALHVSYGQPAAAEEAEAAHRIAGRMGIPLTVVGVPLLGLEAMVAAPGPGARYIPGRNMVLSALGLNMAEAIGAGSVWLGATADDLDGYPDCRPSFVAAMNAAATGAARLAAPLVNLRRSEVRRIAASAGLDSAAWSCYMPVDGKPCGECNSCLQG